eukprot:6045846-Amphidinium_carterae.1
MGSITLACGEPASHKLPLTIGVRSEGTHRQEDGKSRTMHSPVSSGRFAPPLPAKDTDLESRPVARLRIPDF